jgi:ABC-type Fe3+-hydroxamate transport system substrate-binding protein
MILKNVSALISRPCRIVSLVPSQTELLYDLHLEEAVVGITKFCIHPTEWFRNKTRIGGTKNIDIPAIRILQPDLIIANKEENVQQQIEELALDFAVWVTDVNTLGDALRMIADIGQLTHKEKEAGEMVKKIEEVFVALKIPLPHIPAAYLIWKDPFMTVGADTFIHDMMLRAGFENVFAHQRRYPAVTMSELKASGCRVLLLSSEPYPFQQKHIDEFQNELEGIKIILVDGEFFSWYGSRLLPAASYFKQLNAVITGN